MCFQRCREKEKQEQQQCQRLILGRLGVLVSQCSHRAAWGRGHCQGMSHWRISSLHHRCHSMNQHWEPSQPCQGCHTSSPGRTGHTIHCRWGLTLSQPPGVWQGKCTNVPNVPMYQINTPMYQIDVPMYPNPSWLWQICQMLFEMLGHYRDLDKRGTGKSCQVGDNSKFLPRLEKAVQEIRN